jgi:hypothetical protein
MFGYFAVDGLFAPVSYAARHTGWYEHVHLRYCGGETMPSLVTPRQSVANQLNGSLKSSLYGKGHHLYLNLLFQLGSNLWILFFCHIGVEFLDFIGNHGLKIITQIPHVQAYGELIHSSSLPSCLLACL